LTELEKALARKPRTKSANPDKIWIGFTVSGAEAVKVVRTAEAKAGITERSPIISKLYLDYLKSKLNGDDQKKSKSNGDDQKKSKPNGNNQKK